MMLSVKQAAKRLGLSPSSVYALCQSNDLPHHRMGRGKKKPRIVITEEDLEAYLRTTRREGPVRAEVPSLLIQKSR